MLNYDASLVLCQAWAIILDMDLTNPEKIDEALYAFEEGEITEREYNRIINHIQDVASLPTNG